MAVPVPSTIPRWAQLLAWATSTYYALGERVLANGNLYVCSTAGTSAGAGAGPAGGGAGIVDGTATWDFVSAASTAWAGLTAYALGDRVTNGGNLYLCITAGVSAAAGGPAGTTSDITDGTVHWMFLSAGTALVTVPSEGQKDVGWIVGQKPPAQYFNWWMFNVYLWLRWLADLANQAITWTGTHVFQRGIVVNQTQNPAADATGTDSTGKGTGAGTSSTGGATSGSGVVGTGGAPNGYGLEGYGTGSGAGGRFFGGAAGAPGLLSTATGGSAGVQGSGAAGNAGPGVKGTGGQLAAGGGFGGEFDAGPGVAGVKGTGGTPVGGVAGPGGHFTGPGTAVLADPSGANGIGVDARGVGNGAALKASGGVVSEVLLGQVHAAVSDTPAVRLLDRAAHPRFVVDHNGYRFGRLSSFDEGWYFKETLVAAGASAKYHGQAFSMVGNGQTTRVEPDDAGVTLGTPGWSVQNDGLINGDRSFWFSEPLVQVKSFTDLVLEFEVALKTLAGDMGAFAGLVAEVNGDPSLATSGAWVEAHTGVGLTWQGRAKDSVGGDSGLLGLTVGVVIGGAPLTWVRHRIELHGSATAIGTGSIATRWFVNGLLRQESAVRPDQALRLTVGVLRDGAGAGAGDIWLSPVRMVWNRQLDSDPV